MGKFELDDSFDFRVDGLIFANDDVASRLPFEASLAGDDVVGVHLLIAEHFHAALMKEYPSRLPAESLVFWVEEACIFEAMKYTEVVRGLKARDNLWANIFMVILLSK